MKYKRIITEVIIAKSNYSRNFLHLIMKRPGTIPLTKPSPEADAQASTGIVAVSKNQKS